MTAPPRTSPSPTNRPFRMCSPSLQLVSTRSSRQFTDWFCLDALLVRIKEEVRRLQRRHQLKTSSGDHPDEETTDSTSLAHLPGHSNQHLLTLKQVNLICERLLKEREEKIREEYDQILSNKLNGRTPNGAQTRATKHSALSRAIRRFRSVHPRPADATILRTAILL